MEVDQVHRQLLLSVNEQTAAGQVRRAATALAAEIGFSETRRAQLAIIATELATNILKHAQRGEILLRTLNFDTPGMELLALDKGPGMADPNRCLEDGYSTAGSPGTGLGAVRRLSDRFDLYSYPGKGTALVAHMWASTPPAAEPEFGCVSIPAPGERVPGDAWAVMFTGNRGMVTVVDGLGHGAAAAVASEEAIRQIQQHQELAPEAVLQKAHDGLRGTRGATMAVAELQLGKELLTYCGIGNIYGAILTGQGSRSLVSLNGTIGHGVRKYQTFSYPCPTGALLIMHSDGMGTRWNLSDYPGLFGRHPSLVAGVLYRDFHRQRDDVTVLAVRCRRR